LAKHFLNFPATYKLGMRWASYLPTFLSYTISQSIADLSYIVYKSAVKNVKRNLKLVFPTLSDKRLSSMTRNLFRNYSKYLIDYSKFANLNKNVVIEQISCSKGKENLDSALQINKGLILLTAHLGNWELGGIFFGSYGLKTNILTLRDENPEIDNIRRWYRETYGVKTITVGDSPFSTIEMVKALSNKEVVAMLIDRYPGGLNSIMIDFFNKPTLFPRGPFVLSKLTGAPIVVAFVVKEKKAYKGIIKGPFIVRNEKEEYEILKEVVKILEEHIILYPDQWYNFIPI
jgi:lauroyl/myristoyl acyltransferase